ncbi:FixH family protein [Brevibacillus agri]|uniref:FixH family protein n=1 Tax=Brevibacillus agri TaxID=51101 RepID=UPI003D1E98E2|nr:hypothetical protein [Brevibacillus agri]
MKHKTVLGWILFVFISLVASQSVFADVENGLFITGISYDQSFTANEVTSFKVEVVQVKVKEGNIGELENASPVTDAVVTAVFTKGSEKKEITLEHEKDGQYSGEIELPSPGEWSLTVKAERNHSAQVQPNSADKEHEAVFSTPVRVQQPDNQSMPVLMFISVFVAAAIGIVIWAKNRAT